LAVDRLLLRAARAGAESEDGPWLTLAEHGATANADRALARQIFEDRRVRLHLDVGLGRAEATVWTCDLSAEYIRINADYTS
jgi:glutamate N-acetyltransferase/amino-acid N-acetyltransferase